MIKKTMLSAMLIVHCPKVRTCSWQPRHFRKKKKATPTCQHKTDQHGFFVFCIVTRSPSRNGKLPETCNVAKRRKGRRKVEIKYTITMRVVFTISTFLPFYPKKAKINAEHICMCVFKLFLCFRCLSEKR